MHPRTPRQARLTLIALTGAMVAWWTSGAFGSCGVELPIWSRMEIGASSCGGTISFGVYTTSTPARARASFQRWRGGCTGLHSRWHNWKADGWPLARPRVHIGGTMSAVGLSVAGWVPILLCGFVATRIRVPRRRVPGHCPHCDYAMRGLALDATCPECGLDAAQAGASTSSAALRPA